MKANEAPEKIYLATTKEVQNLDHSFVGIAYSDPQDIVEPIEYTRTDAFIEKALKFFSPHIQDNSGGYDRANVIEDFRNYMKGE